MEDILKQLQVLQVAYYTIKHISIDITTNTDENTQWINVYIVDKLSRYNLKQYAIYPHDNKATHEEIIKSIKEHLDILKSNGTFN